MDSVDRWLISRVLVVVSNIVIDRVRCRFPTCTAELVFGWVTVCGRINHLST